MAITPEYLEEIDRLKQLAREDNTYPQNDPSWCRDWPTSRPHHLPPVLHGGLPFGLPNRRDAPRDS